MRVLEQPCYVLVNRPYSESSWIVDVFSRSFGRQALMAKGARRLKSKQRGMLLPFQPLLISWVGKGEVPTLTNAELDYSRFSGWEYELKGKATICGFYCNELLAALVQRGDPNPTLFDFYQQTLDRLLKSSPEKIVAEGRADGNELTAGLFKILRDFELCLIRESGYGVSLTQDANSLRDIEDSEFYEFVPKRGFVSANVVGKGNSGVGHSSSYFQGHVIKSLSLGESMQLHPNARTQSKQIMRMMLSDVLGHKRIMSRDLFFPRV